MKPFVVLLIFIKLQLVLSGDKIYTGLEFVQDEQQQATLLSQLLSWIVSPPEDTVIAFTAQKSGKFWGVTAWNNINRDIKTSELRRKTAMSVLREIDEEFLEAIYQLLVDIQEPLRDIEAARDVVIEELWKVKNGEEYDRERLLSAASLTYQMECYQGFLEAQVYWKIYLSLSPEQIAYFQSLAEQKYPAATAMADFDYESFNYLALYGGQTDKTTVELLAERCFVFIVGTLDDALLIDRGKPVNYYGFSVARDTYRKYYGDSDEFRARLALFMMKNLNSEQNEKIAQLFVDQQDLLLEWVVMNTEVIVRLHAVKEDPTAELQKMGILNYGAKWGLVEGELLLLQTELYREIISQMGSTKLGKLNSLKSNNYSELALDVYSPLFFQAQLGKDKGEKGEGREPKNREREPKISKRTNLVEKGEETFVVEDNGQLIDVVVEDQP